jgi:hypothetical protein
MVGTLSSLAIALFICISMATCRRHGTPPRAFTAAEISQGYVADRIIIRIKPGQAFSPSVYKLVQLREPRRSAGSVQLYSLPKGMSVPDAISQLRRDKSIAYVEPDYLVRIEVVAPKSKAREYRRIQPRAAHATSVTSKQVAAQSENSADIVVAIIDTGVRISHSELRDKLWENPGEALLPSRANGKDDDLNVYPDDLHGIDATVEKGSPNSGKPENAQYRAHGTAVAGIIGASGQGGTGVTGVAENVRLMGLRAFPDPPNATPGIEPAAIYSPVSAIETCIDYAIAKGATVINASFGQQYFSQCEYDAILRARAKGITIVAATGNDDRDNDQKPEYPASYPLDNIIAVTGTYQNGVLRGNYGSSRVDIAARAEEILSCTAETDTSVSDYHNGTSFAAPQVTGTVARLAKMFATDTYRQRINRVLRGAMKASGVDYSGKVAANGTLDVAGALSTNELRPLNDDLATAIVLDGPYIETRASNSDATREPSEQSHGTPPLDATLWWKWRSPSAGTYLVSTEGSEADAIPILYSGTGHGTMSEVFLESSDATGRLRMYRVEATQDYHVAVGSIAKKGGIVLTIGQGPPNDHILRAVTLTGTEWKSGQNRLATKEAEDMSANPSYAGHSVWYTWKAPTTSNWFATLSSEEISAAIAVFERDSAGTLTQLKSAATAGKTPAKAAFHSHAGKIYYLMVDSQNPGVGGFDIQMIAAP